MMRGWALAALIALGGCKDPGALQTGADPQVVPHEEGRRIYNFRCYFCHGYSGDAKTVAASYLAPPPRDFTAGGALDRRTIAHAVRDGRSGTAMKSFASTLSEHEIERVAAFVEREFVLARAPNTRYHTRENGWPDHDRYRSAFAFATGAIPLDANWDTLTPEQTLGRQLFMTSCVSCHDRGSAGSGEPTWEIRAVSYPPSASSCLSCHNREGVPATGPSPHAQATAREVAPTYAGRSRPSDPGDPHEIHDRVPVIAGLTAIEQRGEKLYQGNCAFCHAADGTGRNWIGAFIEPHPANFNDAARMKGMTRTRLRTSIRDGVEGTPMPAWKSVLSDAEIDAVIAYIARAFGAIGDARAAAGASARQ